MASNCGIPLARLYLLPQRALLKIDVPGTVQQMKMHYRMQILAAAMTLSTRGFSNGIASGIYYWEQFGFVVAFHAFFSFSMIMDTSRSIGGTLTTLYVDNSGCSTTRFMRLTLMP